MTAPNPQAPWDHPPAFPQLCAYLAERAPQPTVAVEGLTHIIRYVNPAFCRLVGQPASSLINRCFADAIPEGVENGCADLLDRAFSTGTHEVIVEQPHGKIPGVYWSYSVWAILGPDGDPVGVAVQVTDSSEIATFRHRLTTMNSALLTSSVAQHEQSASLAAELQSAERLAAIGTLAAGIGHDIGNLLLPIRMRISAMEHDLLPGHSDDLEALRAPLEFLQRLTNSLKLLALDPAHPIASGASTDLAEWWPDIFPMIRVALPASIALEHVLPGPIPPLAIAPAALSQALFNLVQNAGEAITEAETPRGTIRIAAALAPAAADTAPRVLITVTDNGPGMIPEVLRRCMDPFFSTKARRISTGMGLPLIRGIILRSGGNLSVQSEPGRGTTFTIDLPAAPPTPEYELDCADPAPATASQAAPRECRTAVTITSPQSRAYVLWVLTSLGVSATVHDAPAPPDADLWIAEPRDELVQALHNFILPCSGDPPRQPRRQLLIYGDPPASLARAANAPLAAPMSATGKGLLLPKLRPILASALRRSFHALQYQS